jgi:hypothetical protein
MSRQVVANTASKIEFFAINNDSGVPNSIDLMVDDLSGMNLGHAA